MAQEDYRNPRRQNRDGNRLCRRLQHANRKILLGGTQAVGVFGGMVIAV